MDLNTKPGSFVRFLGENGYPHILPLGNATAAFWRCMLSSSPFTEEKAE